MPGHWGHLAARFFDVITSRRLDRGETQAVRRWVGEGPLLEAFFSQPVADQRHGFEAAVQVLAHVPDRLDLVRAALLHDIGKRHARLGPAGRVIASLAMRLDLPLTSRQALYRDHGPLAAAELSGDLPVVVDFARHHHGARPGTIPEDEWVCLQAADRARPMARTQGNR